MSDTTKESFMKRAIKLAKNGEGFTNPNPLVGAVIVKDNKIIGEGWHHKYGDLHAEREALINCIQSGNNPEGAEIYVTLEPCCHFGKQPPCTHALVEAKIKKVYVGSRDPNPLVHGKGNQYLRENGISVEEDFLKSECDSLNPIFFHYISTKTPYVALKYAMTLDGKICTTSGKSKWISNEQSRNYVQVLRNKYAGILAGIGTVLADDPMLNCRLKNGNNPTRIICDTNLRIPLESKIVKTSREIPTIIATASKNSENAKLQQLKNLGIQILFLDTDLNGKFYLHNLMKVLGEQKIDSVLIEGGGEINFTAIQEGIVNHIYAFVAPKIFGGSAKSPVMGKGIDSPENAFNFQLSKTTQFDQDLLLEYERIN